MVDVRSQFWRMDAVSTASYMDLCPRMRVALSSLMAAVSQRERVWFRIM